MLSGDARDARRKAIEWAQRGEHMQQVAISDVDQAGAVVPPHVLRALGAVSGDKVAFVENDNGPILLIKAASAPSGKRPISEIVGVFSTGERRTPEDDKALLREIRYGDELDEHP